MRTNCVSSICVYEDTDIKALIANAGKSETDVCIISGNAEQQSIDEVVLALKEQNKTVMAPSRHADIMYLTEEHLILFTSQRTKHSKNTLKLTFRLIVNYNCRAGRMKKTFRFFINVIKLSGILCGSAFLLKKPVKLRNRF